MPKGLSGSAGLAVEVRTPSGGHLHAAVRDCLELSICLLDGRARPEQIRGLERQAARWAREGVPIETMLGLLHDGVRLGVELSGDVVHTGDHLRAVDTDLVVGLLNTVTATVARAYTLHPQTAVRALCAALLNGRPTSALARQCGIEIADRYWIIAVAVPPAAAPAERTARSRADHRVRGIQAELAWRFRGAALSTLSPHGGTVLLPVTRADDAALDALLADLSLLTGTPLTATLTHSVTADIPTGTDHAHELLDLVHRLGLGARLYRFADLALEFQLTRPGPGLERLGTLLDPLDSRPELLATLHCHVANELNRRRTARLLHVHPNTLDHRLKRITELTGLNPAHPPDMWRLRAALIAHNHDAAPPRAPRPGGPSSAGPPH